MNKPMIAVLGGGYNSHRTSMLIDALIAADYPVICPIRATEPEPIIIIDEYFKLEDSLVRVRPVKDKPELPLLLSALLKRI